MPAAARVCEVCGQRKVTGPQEHWQAKDIDLCLACLARRTTDPSFALWSDNLLRRRYHMAPLAEPQPPSPTDPPLRPVYGRRDTSRAAAESVREQRPQGGSAILAYLRRTGGATCDEVEVALGLLHQSASAAINGLEGRGQIVDSTVRRPTRTGRAAIVWVAADLPPE